MRCQVLSSGSEGNSTLIRAGDTTLLVDGGLVLREQRARMQAAGLGHKALDHILVTHGHLDHARSTGGLARKEDAVLHCPERMMRNRSVRRAAQLSTITIGRTMELRRRDPGLFDAKPPAPAIAGLASEPMENGHAGPVLVLPVLLKHDCDPTVSYRIEHAGRVVVILTDLGRPDAAVARTLHGAHVLVLEFNYDPELMANGPYSPALQRRITGGRGHLSNEEAGQMLELLADPELHTVVLAHISKKTNRPELALESARAALARAGRDDVRVLVASQDEIGDDLAV
jgi:phosphoribosyl 1,2-cyclic phosphodiesterase